MDERTIVGVAGADVSRRAVEWAAARAQERRGHLELITVVGGAVGAIGEGPVIEEALRDAESGLDREADRLRERGLSVEIRAERGNPVERLVHASTRADLLVIGSDHRGPGEGPRRGPHGLRIVAGAHCPVVVVPDIDLAGRHGVVVGVDGSALSERAIEFAAAEADRAGERLTAVNAWLPVPLPTGRGVHPPAYLANMQSLAEETLAVALAGVSQRHPDLEIHRVVERGYAETVINRLAATARLTVVGSRGRGAIARFLLGSTSQEVLGSLVTVTAIVR
ncbi:MAG: universal stress protein [Actinomycetota bacterium]